MGGAAYWRAAEIIGDVEIQQAARGLLTGSFTNPHAPSTARSTTFSIILRFGPSHHDEIRLRQIPRSHPMRSGLTFLSTLICQFIIGKKQPQCVLHFFSLI